MYLLFFISLCGLVSFAFSLFLHYVSFIYLDMNCEVRGGQSEETQLAVFEHSIKTSSPRPFLALWQIVHRYQG